MFILEKAYLSKSYKELYLDLGIIYNTHSFAKHLLSKKNSLKLYQLNYIFLAMHHICLYSIDRHSRKHLTPSV